MQNFNLSNLQSTLHHAAVLAAANYRRSEWELIEALIKVDSSKLFKRMGYTSLYQYSVDALKLSEATSYVMITVARKSVEVPELKVAVQNEKITVSKAAKLSACINKDNAGELLSFAARHMVRELEFEVSRRNPKASKADNIRVESAERVRLGVSVSRDLLEKLKRVQDLLAQRSLLTDLESTLDEMASDYLKRHDPLQKAKRAMERIRRKQQAAEAAAAAAAATEDKSADANRFTNEVNETESESASHSATEAATEAANEYKFVSADNLSTADANEHRSESATAVDVAHRSGSVSAGNSGISPHWTGSVSDGISGTALSGTDSACGTDDTSSFMNPAALKKDAEVQAKDDANSNTLANSSTCAAPKTCAGSSNSSNYYDLSLHVKSDSGDHGPCNHNPSHKYSKSKRNSRRSSKSKRIWPNAQQKHTVNAKDECRCTFTDQHGQRCTNRRYLQTHHIIEVWRGGTNEPENLTTLCAAHHDLVHQLSFGIEGDITWLRAPQARYVSTCIRYSIRDILGSTNFG